MSEIQEAVLKYDERTLHWVDFYERLIQEKANYADTYAWDAFLDGIKLRRKYAIIMRAYNYLSIKFPDLLKSKDFKGSIYAIAQLPKLVNYLENKKTLQQEIDDTIKKVLNGELGDHLIRKIVEQKEKDDSITYMTSFKEIQISSEQEKALKSFTKMLDTLDCLIDSTVSIVGLRKVRSETGNECRKIAKKLLSVFSETYKDEEIVINI